MCQPYTESATALSDKCTIDLFLLFDRRDGCFHIELPLRDAGIMLTGID